MAKGKSKNKSKKQNQKGKQRATQAIESTATPSSSTKALRAEVDPFNGTFTSSAPPEKRDSVISSTWEDTKQKAGSVSKSPLWYQLWWQKLRRQRLCRIVLAVARAVPNLLLRDTIIAIALLVLWLGASYAAIGLVLEVLRGVSAQDTDGSCSVVYVTVTGPVITTSLVSPPNWSSTLFTQPTSTTSPIPATSRTASISIPVTSIISASSVPATTLLPPGFDNASTIFGEHHEFATRVISYGDTAFRFIFPMPNITTTVSYWTGVYPTVTGPLPSEFQTLALTTRTKRQTPLSALPSFEVFTSTQSRFKTIVTTTARRNATSGPRVAKRTEDEDQTSNRTTATELTISAPTRILAAIVEPEPTLCGESGNFTLTFDDTVVGGDNKVLLVANGMKNPYHHLFYANGYTYVPDKWDPYPAVSQPNVAMFLPLAGRLLLNTPFAGTLLPGELGAGPRASVSAYWFNAYSAYFGCALNGLTPCTLRISGFRYDSVLREEVLVVEQTATLPACWGYIKCRLTRVFFNDQFRALSGIQFNAYTYNLGIPQIHMMDDLQMEWYNNSCSAGILRIGHR